MINSLLENFIEKHVHFYSNSKVISKRFKTRVSNKGYDLNRKFGGVPNFQIHYVKSFKKR